MSDFEVVASDVAPKALIWQIHALSISLERRLTRQTMEFERNESLLPNGG